MIINECTRENRLFKLLTKTINGIHIFLDQFQSNNVRQNRIFTIKMYAINFRRQRLKNCNILGNVDYYLRKKPILNWIESNWMPLIWSAERLLTLHYIFYHSHRIHNHQLLGQYQCWMRISCFRPNRYFARQFLQKEQKVREIEI